MPTNPVVRAAFDAAKYQRRKAQAITFLGGKCVRCGSVEDLNFDHIDASTKSYTITKILTHGWSKIRTELKKCQLLCFPCHRAKTRENEETGGGQNKWTEIKHGTVHAYAAYKCRCEECRKAKRIYETDRIERSVSKKS